MNILDQIAEWVRENPGKTAGAACGFIIGILLFTIGWWKTMIVVILVMAGFMIGKSRDDNVSLVDQITGLFRRNRD
ncbi:MAG: DUF2273 domain-containing protein [Chrysiogenales bacterium]|nr:MAG: DUF2273 domain-containing protein [Chrysiogenales bacterium]